MRIADRDKVKFEELGRETPAHRRGLEHADPEMRDGSVGSLENLRIDTQNLHVRHQHLIWDMIDLLIY